MNYRADLQGLRAVAVLLVIAHHFFPQVSTGGFIGVDIFFVISGYIITSVLIRDRHKDLASFLIDFYARRIRRILPSALLVIVLAVMATYYFLGEITGADTARDGRAAALFFANVHFNALNIDYFASGLPEPILQHYWSLAIEEQFYLFWPVIFFLFTRRLRWALLVVALTSLLSLIWALLQVESGSGTAYLATLTRIWELGVGAIIALWGKSKEQKWISYLALIALLAMASLITESSGVPGFSGLLVVMTTALVIITGNSNQALRSRTLVKLGDQSYILYLVHWPVLQIFTLYQGREAVLPEKTLLILLVFAISAIIHRFFENPIRFSNHLIRSPRLSIGIGLSSLTLTVLALSILGGSS